MGFAGMFLVKQTHPSNTKKLLNEQGIPDATKLMCDGYSYSCHVIGSRMTDGCSRCVQRHGGRHRCEICHEVQFTTPRF